MDLTLSILQGDLSSAEQLVQAGEHIELTAGSTTPLHLLATRPWFDEGVTAIDLLRHLLVATGTTNVDIQDSRGWTPLMYAVYGRNYALAEGILNFGCDVDIRANDGRTILHMIAAHECKEQLVRGLIHRSQNLNVIDNNSHTPLHEAIKCGYYAVAELLIDAGCDVNAISVAGRTSLHLAVQNANIILISKIVKRTNAKNFDIVDKMGATPLFIAISRQREDVCKMLLQFGASPNVFGEISPLSCLLSRDQDRNKVYNPTDDVANRTIRLCKMLIEFGAWPEKLPAGLVLVLRDEELLQLLLKNDFNFYSDMTFSYLLEESRLTGDQLKMAELIQHRQTLFSSLRILCRGKIRKLLFLRSPGGQLSQMVDKLPLPTLMKKYVI